MASIWTDRIAVSFFGEAEGMAVGVTIDNLPPGEYLDTGQLRHFLTRHMCKVQGTSAPAENHNFHEDINAIQLMSGILNGRTTGSPLCAFIRHAGTPVQRVSQINRLVRPGHADYTGTLRYRGFNDIRDGGSTDAFTVPLCFAGAVCGQILERRGIYTGGHIQEIHGIRDTAFCHTTVSKEEILAVRYKSFPVIADAAGEQMQADIEKAANGGETLGGCIECTVVNLPAGIGSPVFHGLQTTIGQLLFALPDVQGVSFGAGFQVTEMTGSQCNDSFYVNQHGHIRTHSNNHGGILGGISSGMPVILHVAFRPSANIGAVQDTVNLSSMEQETIPAAVSAPACLVPGLVPCVEAAVNIALLSHMMDYPHFC